MNDGYYLPGHFGIFIDELAKNVDQLTLIMHSATMYDDTTNDYRLTANNIKLINLGVTTPAWHRAIFHKSILGKIKPQLVDIDTLIVRSPCAFAPFFHKYVLPRQKLWFMVVGNYYTGAKHWRINSIKNLAIKYYLYINNYLFTKNLYKYNLLVNSKALFDNYNNTCKQLFQIKTTTLTKQDFYKRNDTCTGDSIEMLYTGRIDPAKGLFELIEATSLLIKSGHPCKLNIVGWEIKEGAAIESQMKNYAEKLGIKQAVIFHGKKQVGEELNKMYRKADIYVIPSYHEGFPRTIWEAMANGLPVITTPVGGIPDELNNEVNALFVAPKSATAVKEAVERIIRDKVLRQQLIANAHKLVQANTLETQTKMMVDIIKANP